MPDVAVLEILLHGQAIGTLVHLPGDKSLFSFSQEYLDNPHRPTLSLSYKDIHGELITETKPTQTRVPPFFSNLLPEGRMRDYLAARAGVNPLREFFLLWALGRDLPGAVKIRPAAGQPWPPGGDQGVENFRPEEDRDPVLRFSLAGVQIKFSAIQEARGGLTIPADGAGGAWIVKLPSLQYPGVPENEYAMLELARRIGIDVPETALLPTHEIAGLPKTLPAGVGKSLAIKRFDRGAGDDRVHMEDFAQVFGVYPERKYRSASYRNIAEVVWIETGEQGITEFVRRLVFMVLIGNGDMHLKNWSLIYPNTRNAVLAPAYDLLSTIAYLPEDGLALTFVDSKAFGVLDVEQFERFAAKARLPERLVVDTVRETVQAFAGAWERIADVPLDPHVREAIEAHRKTIPLWRRR